MTKETKAKKTKKAKEANCDSENILFQVMISYRPAHEVALWRVAVHLIKFLTMYIRVGIYSWLALPTDSCLSSVKYLLRVLGDTTLHWRPNIDLKRKEEFLNYLRLIVKIETDTCGTEIKTVSKL